SIQDDSNNPFLTRRSDGSKAYAAGDAWSHALNLAAAPPPTTFERGAREISYDISKFQTDKENAPPPKYDIFSCRLVNSSPGGYCLQWTSATPASVKTGEILAVRETEQSNWAIAVIRWVKQFKTEGTRMGIELLAPKATPAAARVVQKTGDLTEYMRALVLPELRAIGQPSTLITPSVPFQVGQKIMCTLNGEELKGQLIKLVTSTASISQFQFKLFGQKMEEQPQKQSAPLASPTKNDDDFDSLWSSL
ncbi:MAG TPA: GTPase, partial [Pseudomonadales bacterium]|nr:GTPase [Pseudomonadales bacterium]